MTLRGQPALPFRPSSARIIDGVADLGVRPIFQIEQPLLEVLLFDFDESLYDQTGETELVAFLRGEMAFDGLEALKVQIETDVAAALGSRGSAVQHNFVLRGI